MRQTNALRSRRRVRAVRTCETMCSLPTMATESESASPANCCGKRAGEAGRDAGRLLGRDAGRLLGRDAGRLSAPLTASIIASKARIEVDMKRSNSSVLPGSGTACCAPSKTASLSGSQRLGGAVDGYSPNGGSSGCGVKYLGSGSPGGRNMSRRHTSGPALSSSLSLLFVRGKRGHRSINGHPQRRNLWITSLIVCA